MKQASVIIQSLMCAALVCNAQIEAFNLGKTMYVPRSQSVNAARELVGWYEGINRYDVGDYYGSFSATPEFTRTFQSRHIARYFFGTDVLKFSGSRVPDRSPEDILADYFGLPTDYKSTVLVTPCAENALLDFDWYCGLDAWYPGLYFRIHAPLVYTIWGLHLEEYQKFSGMNNYPAGYMGPELIERSAMNCTVLQSLAGGVSFGDYQGLRYGKVGCDKHAFGLSEIQLAFGWNMVNSDHYHFGINARGSIPTGTRPNGTYIFEPIIGNGHHGELGIGFTGHAMTLYCNDEWMIGIYGDANLTHLFSTRQRRSFDFLKHGSGSRYILMESMITPAEEGFTVNGIQAQYQYGGEIIPAINKSTLDCWVSIPVQLDLAGMLVWEHNNINVEVGYNLWMRTGEKLQSRDCFPNDRFAFKGDAQVYGFLPEYNTPIPLNATQSYPAAGGVSPRVSLEAGQGKGSASQIFANTNADNAGNAAFKGTQLNQSYAPDGIIDTGLEDADITHVEGSNPPVLLNDSSIEDLSALCGSASTNKFFMHVGYTFVDCRRSKPYIGLGGEIELDGASTRNAVNSFSQWGIWLKGGVSY